MNGKSSLATVILTLGIFAAWESTRHLLLMGLSMSIQHFISAFVGIALALIIAGVAVRECGQRVRETEKSTRLARIIADTVAATVSLQTGGKRFSEEIASLREDVGRDAPVVLLDKIESLRKRAQQLETVMANLAGLLGPTAPP